MSMGTKHITRGGLITRLAIAALAVAVCLALMPSLASADNIVISAQEAGVNGGLIIQVASGSGTATWTGNYGTFTINQVQGMGSPYLAEPSLNTTSMNVSGSTGGVLNVFVTEQGLTAPATSLLSTFTSNMFQGSVSSVAVQTFVGDPGSVLTPLGSYTFTPSGLTTSSSVNSVSLPSTYDETAEYTITTTGSGSVNDSADIAAGPVSAPESSTLLLLGIGLGSLLLASRRRRVLVQA